MQNLLDQLSEVVDQVHDHHFNHQCSMPDLTAVKAFVCKLSTLAPKHRRRLQYLSVDPAFCKTFKHLIKPYQSMLIYTLNSLFEMQISCKEKHENEDCLLRKTLNTLIELLCFLHKQFPQEFNDSLPIPLPAYERQKEEINQSLGLLRNMLLMKKVNKPLLNVVLHPFWDFLEDTKEYYSFCDLAFLKSWMIKLAKVCKKPQTKKEFEKLLCIAIVQHDLNSQECMDYCSEFFSKMCNLQDSKAEQLEVLRLFLKSVEQVQASNQTGYDPNAKKIRSFLIKWLRQEISFIEASCHISEQSTFKTKDNDKIPTNLPVAELGFIIRLWDKTDIFKSAEPQELFNLFSKYFSSKKKINPSPGNLSNGYYCTPPSSILKVKKMLKKQLDLIEQNKF